MLHRMDIKPSGNSKDDYRESVLSSGRQIKDIRRIAYEVETASPKKHFVVFRWSGSLPESVPLKQFSSDVCPALRALDLAFHSVGSEFQSFTLEHRVTSVEWVLVDPNTKDRHEEAIRHPVVVRVYPSLRLLTLSYPGYPHSALGPTGDRVPYTSMVADVVNAVVSEFGWKVEALPFRHAIETLIDLRTHRFKRIKASPKVKSGSLTITTTSNGQSTEEFLAQYVASKFSVRDVQELESAISQAFRSSSMTAVVLFWPQEGVCTRVEFWGNGCEFLFIWNKADHTYPVCFSVFSALLAAVPASSKALSVERLLREMSADLLLPGDVLGFFGGTPELVRDVLVGGVSAGLLAPVFRLKTDELVLEAENAWVLHPALLSRVFTTETGRKIDGREPKNIEIAYQRLSEAGEPVG